MKVYLRVAGALALAFAFVSASWAANAPEVDKGLTWLQSQVKADGTIANEQTSIATPLQARTETLITLTQLGATSAPLATLIAADKETTTEWLARRAWSLGLAGQTQPALFGEIFTDQNPDGGLGADVEFQSNPVDSTFTLLALKTLPSYDSAKVSAVLGYLSQSKLATGGWGINEQPSVYATAYTLLAANAWKQQFSVGSISTSAQDWLLSQRANGAFLRTLDNALALWALSTQTSDATILQPLINALKASQQADGSWGQDPYLTALALRALWFVGQTPPPATTGDVSGSVIDDTTGTALAGVSLALTQDPSITGTSGTDGSFALSGIKAGNYTLTLGKLGYENKQLAVTITAGQSLQLGSIRLKPASLTASLSGQIKDQNGTALADVIVAVGTVSTFTNATGNYQLTGLNPGNVTITATKANYQTASAPAAFEAGRTYVFSPTLYPVNVTPPAPSLKGKVIDAVSKAGIANAQVTVGVATATTAADGTFAIGNLTAGSFNISVAATGYLSLSGSGTLVAGVNDVGVLSLTKPPATSVVSGIVTDAATAAPIAGANIGVQGTSLTAATAADGKYLIANIATTAFQLVVSAPGYLTSTVSVTLPQVGSATVDLKLTKQQPSGIAFDRVAPEKTPLAPNNELEVLVDVRNTTSAAIDMIVDAQVLDAQNNVTFEIKANARGLGQNPPNVPLSFAAASTQTLKLKRVMVRQPAGNYRIIVRGYDVSGRVIAEGSTTMTVTAEAVIGGGVIIDPPLAQAGTNVPVRFAAQVGNFGNQAIGQGNFDLTVTLVNPDTDTSTVPQTSARTLVSGTPFASPRNVVADAAGNVYTVNYGYNDGKIIKIDAQGQTSVAAALPANTATYLVDLAIDAQGNFWVASYYQKVWTITPQGAATAITLNTIQSINGIDVDADGNLFVVGIFNGEYRLVKRVPAGTETILWANGLNSPVGAVRDGQGNFVIANYGDNTLVKVSPSGVISAFASGLNRPAAIAKDASGNYFVANTGDNTITKVAPDGTKSTFASALNQPSGLAFDAQGNLFVANQGDSSILKITSGGAISVFAKGIANRPQGMAYDASGNLFIANDDGTLRKLDAQGQVTVVATGLSSPRGVTTDSAGAVYVANYSDNTIAKIAGATKTTFATGLVNPNDIATNGSGFMVAEYGRNALTRLSASGTIQSSLESLFFNPSDIRIDGAGRSYVLNSGFITVIENGIPRKFFKDFSPGYITVDPVAGGLVVLYGYDVYRISVAGVATKLKSLPFYPYGVAVDATGNILIADYGNKRVQKLDSAGNVTILATLSDYVRIVASDLSGNVYAVQNDYKIFKIAADGTATLITALTEYPYGLSAAPNGKLVTWTNYGRVYSLDPATGVLTQLVQSVYPSGAAIDATGKVLLTYSGENDFVAYSSGAEVSRQSGFYYPRNVVWNGSDYVFTDSSSRAFLVGSGATPTKISSNFYSNNLTVRGGQLLSTYGNQIRTLSAGQTQTVLTVSGASNLAGIAISPTGRLTVADNNYSRVISFDSANAVVADYAGVVQPSGIAFDGQGRLHVANFGSGTISRFENGASNPTFLARPSYTPKALTFDGTGSLWVTTSYGVSKVDATGGVTDVVNGIYLESLLVDANGVFGVDRNNSQLRKLSGTTWPVVASGLVQPSAIRLGADGSAYVANRSNRSIVRYASNQLALVAGELPTPINALDVLGDGRLLVAGDQGALNQIAADGSQQQLNIQGLVGNTSLYGVASRADGKLIVIDNAYPNANAYEVAVTQAVTPPAAGTIVYQASVPVSSIPVGEALTAINFGNWTPPYGGDFKAEVSRNGVPGILTNFLHVGPYAQGILATDGKPVPPGDQTVGVSLKLTGADFTSISRVETGLVKPVTSIGGPNGMTADRAGNIYFTDGASLKRATPGGTTTDVVTGLSTRFGLAVDSQERFYLPNYSGSSYQLLRVLADGTKTVVADLGTGGANGVAVNSKDEIFVGAPGKLLKINPTTGAVSTFSTAGIPQPRGIAIDGRDNIYVQNEGNLVTQIRTDGSAVTVFSKGDGVVDPIFEGDGYPNIAADCADNFYIATSQWGRINQSGEEHTLAQVISRTGKVALLFDAVTIDPYLNDIDYLAFERFGNRILMWNHYQGTIWQVPVTCGAIGVEAHAFSRPGQTLSGFSRTPSATIALPDGRTEYVWSLRDVTSQGASIAFDAALKGLKLGDSVPAIDSGFILFKNSFSSTDVRVPLQIPNVNVVNLVNVGVSTDKPEYAALSTAQIAVTLGNANNRAVNGTLQISVYDSNGALVSSLPAQAVMLPANGSATANATFGIGTLIPANYSVRASLTDTGLEQARAFTALRVLPDNTAATAKSSLSLDKVAYNASDRALISSRAQNQSVNVILENLMLTVRVRNAANTVLFTQHHQINQLLAGAGIDFSDAYAFTNAPEGTYTVEQVLADATGREYDRHVVQYAVGTSTSTGFGLTGTIVPQPKQAYVADTMKLDFSVTNKGNADFTALPLKVSILDPVGGQVVSEFPATADVAQGQTKAAFANWVVAGTEGATYIAALSATVNGKSLALAQDNVKILVCTPVTPIAFTLAAQTGIPLNTAVTSNTVTLAGLICRTPISITGGTYSINGGAFTNQPGFVRPGDSVAVRLQSANGYAVTTSAGLSINGVVTTFSVTTIASQPPTVSITAPTNNAVFQLGAAIKIDAVAANPNTGGSIAKVEFFQGSTKLGESTLAPYSFSWTNATAGTYTITARVTDDKGLTAASAPITVIVNAPPTVSITAPANNATFTAPATIKIDATAADTDGTIAKVEFFQGAVKLGESAAAPYSFNWTGVATGTYVLTAKATDTRGAMATSAAVAVKVGGGDTTPDPFTFTPQIDVPLNSVRTSNVVTITGIDTATPISIVGGKYSVNGGAYTDQAGTVKNGDTVAVQVTSSNLYATAVKAMLAVGTLSGDFKVTTLAAGKVDVTQTFSRDSKLLVLLTCKSSSEDKTASVAKSSDGEGDGEDDEDKDDTTCDAKRAAFLDNYLTGLGIEHKIVTSISAFRTEFRCGKYNTYWISGGAAKLKNDLAEEVREAVFRGDALIVDGQHDERNKDLDEVVGIDYKGKQSTAGQAVTLINTALPVGTLPTTGKGLKINVLAGATVLGKFANTDPAIVGNAYGQGRGMHYAFDLVDALSANATLALYKDTVTKSLAYLAPATPATWLGSTTPTIAIAFKNSGITAQVLDIIANIPTGVSVVSSKPAASTNSTQAVWRVNLDAGQSQTVNLTLRVPNASGTVTLNTVVERVEGNASTQIGIYPFDIVVKTSDAIYTKVKADLMALTLTASKEKQARDQTLKDLADAQDKLAKGQYEDAIAKYVDATDGLDKITSINPAVYQVAIDQLLQQAERNWCTATVPLCPASIAVPQTLANSNGFALFNSKERFEVRSGKPGNSSEDGAWEWGLGVSSEDEGGKGFVTQNMTWVSAKSYSWSLNYDAKGNGTYSVKDGATQLFTKTYTGSTGKLLRAGNGLRVAVTASGDAGSAKIESSVTSINGINVSGTLATPGNGKDVTAALLYYYPPMTAGFTVNGTVKLTFTGSKPPEEDKLRLLVNAGTLSCYAQ